MFCLFTDLSLVWRRDCDTVWKLVSKYLGIYGLGLADGENRTILYVH